MSDDTTTVLPHVDARTEKSLDAAVQVPRAIDPVSREWLRCLRADGAAHDDAISRLHDLLLRAARFEVNRRRATLPHLRGNELDDIALEAADDALMSVLAHLDDFRGLSRFTTWVYKFALLEAAVKLRRRAWQGREVPLEPDTLGPLLEPRSAAGTGGRAIRAASCHATTDRRDADATPATCPRRTRTERNTDRRARRTPEHDPRRPLQDSA